MSMGHDDFLRTVQTRAGWASGVIGANGQMRLHGHFWSYDEIQSGLALRRDWGVDQDLIPFFGDWHEVICLSSSTGRVIYLDDSRHVISSWSDTEAFMESLAVGMPESESSESSRLVHSEISSGLAGKVQALLQAKKP